MQPAYTATLLLVEDEQITAMAEKKTLESHGFCVIAVYGGKEAIAALENNPHIDLILMDIQLGGDEDCFKTVEIIMAQYDIPLVFLSSHTEEAIVRKAESFLPYGYVVKNSGETILLASIRMALQLFAAKKQAREKTEELLYFQKAVAYASDAIGMSTPEGRHYYQNEAFTRLFGYDVETLGKLGPAACIYADVHAGEDVFRTIMDGGEWTGELTMVNREKQTFEVFLRAYAITNTQGAVLGLVGMHTDIRERKRTEQALRASEEQFRTIVESSPMGMYFYHLEEEGQLVFAGANPAADAIIGIRHEDLTGKPIEEAFPRLTEAGIPEMYRKVARGETGPVAFEIDYEEGAIKGCFAVTVFPTGRETIAVIFFDISERKETERELRESEERARRQRAALSSLVLDADCISGAMLPAMRRITEVLAVTMNVERASIWKLAPGAGILECLSLYEKSPDRYSEGQMLDTAGIPEYFEALLKDSRVYTSDARYDVRTRALAESYLIPCGISSMLDAAIMLEGALYGVVCIEHVGGSRVWHSDEEAFASTVSSLVAQIIADQKRRDAEADMLKMENQLQHSQKMESIGRLAGGVAHDFNNMLGVILGHTEMALKDIGKEHPLYTDLQAIGKAAQRSADLTRQLLAFARKQTISPRILDLNESIESVMGMLSRLIGEQIRLEWRPGTALQKIHMDPSQLDQILANLCVNARDAIGLSGQILIETSNTSLDAQYCDTRPEAVPGVYVLLAISDDGCGMDKETMQHLFEPFFTTKALGEGTGLGLATIYGIVKQNRGHIAVYSETGRGTTVRVYLPCHEEGPEEQKTQKTQKITGIEKPGTGTILLVEDEPAILSVTTAMLELQGYTVLSAGSPEEAISLASSHKGIIDLLMSDVIMPGMNGRELSVKLLASRSEMKCLYTSGYTASVIEQHGVLDPHTHFVQKPFSLNELAVAVRKVLES